MAVMHNRSNSLFQARIRQFVVCALVGFAAVLWMPMLAHAFAVSPASTDISVERGETFDGVVSVINNGAAEQTFYLGTISFAPGPSGGTPQFLSPDQQSEASTWISFPVPTLSTPAWTKVDVPYRVVVPPNAQSGTAYAAITVSTAPSEVVETNGASVEARVASLLFITVAGETVEKLAVLDFVTPDSSVVAHDISYAYRVQNQGNIAIVPKTSIQAQDMFGRRIFQIDANPDGGRVLPGTTRTFNGELAERPNRFWDAVRTQWSRFAIGPVTATVSVEGAVPAPHMSVRYWMFPWQLCVVFMGTMLITGLSWRGMKSRRAIS